MDKNIQVNGKMIKWKEKELTHGLITRHTSEIGKIIIWMD